MCRAVRHWRWRMMPFPMPAAMRDEIPEVTAMTRSEQNDITLTAGDRQFLERVSVGRSGFLPAHQAAPGRGRSAHVFRQPQSLVLSQSAARKYFGDADPIGKIISPRSSCDARAMRPAQAGRSR